MEAMYSDAPKLIPATESSLKGLEKVRLDSLEDAVKQMPCSICMGGLDHYDAAEEGADHPHMIARLPCAHTFHADCIVQWLKTNYRCPLCRSPIVEAGEPSKPPLRLHWSIYAHDVCGWCADCYRHFQIIEPKQMMKI
ncbi:E3 ubiquitin-protein ligase SIS3-like [Rosa chinensis]|uniref:E3 ubiquitin-protein ligase SIS3-like n=1 Tax=Rosa chinensis TaxID=74649 RepID=UPI000D094F1B|nr:E3 ubiquitin-protein ligase SIS3-like [Rosa chinensis]